MPSAWRSRSVKDQTSSSAPLAARTLLDAGNPSRQDHRESQVRVGGRVDRPQLDPRGGPLVRLVHRDPNQCGPLFRPQQM